MTKILKYTYNLVGLSRKKTFKTNAITNYLSSRNGNQLIANYLKKKEPRLIGRLGFVEANALLNWLESKKHTSNSLLQRIDAILGDFRSEWDPNVISLLQSSAGVFPSTSHEATAFSQAYLQSIKACDSLGYIGGISGEGYLIKNFCPLAEIFQFQGLEPYLHEDPWSHKLKGMDVLVVHPFSKSIESQYKKRELIFKNKNVLPEFNLQTLQAVQSMQDNHVKYESWSMALDAMKQKLSGMKFDVCIVGAGAYGMPLCEHVKKMGKIAIYMGGATQILFGIKGKRWEDHYPEVVSLFNEHWVRPSEEEKPQGFKKMEGACYW
jgi:hypothetical protein